MKRFVACICTLAMLLSSVTVMASGTEVREEMAASYGAARYISESAALKEYCSKTGFGGFEYGYIVAYQGGFGGGGADASLPVSNAAGSSTLAFDARIIADDFCSVTQLFSAMYPEESYEEMGLTYPASGIGRVSVTPDWEDEYSPEVNYPVVELSDSWQHYEIDISNFQRFRLYIDALGAMQGAGECSAVIVANLKLLGNGGNSGNVPEEEHHVLPGPSDWAVAEIEKGFEYGILNKEHMPLGFYQGEVSRYTFAAMITNCIASLKGRTFIEEYSELEENNRLVEFDDTTSMHVITAASLGIVNGVGNNMFAPDKSITRQEMAVMMYRAIKYMESIIGRYYVTDSTDISGFEDAGAVADWAVPAVATLAENGIMNGTSSTTLSPLNNATTEQAAALAVRIYEFMK